jgi:hypothetical protein
MTYRYLGLTAFLVLLCVGLAPADNPPLTMMHIRYRIVPGGVKAGKYRLERVDFWRSGDRFLREDREPTKENEFLSTVIAADTDIWTVHEKRRYAFHFDNPDRAVNAAIDVFHGARLNIFGDLPFGREVEYFAEHGSSLPPREVHRKLCEISQLTIDSTTLTLCVLKTTGLPFVLQVVDGRYDYEVRYERYETALPFDSTLFALPDSVRVIN